MQLDEALKYLGAGYSVIPVSAKIPMVRWEQYQQRLPTEQDIDTWWTAWPDADIALITGKVSGLVAVDVDDQSLFDWKI